MVMSKRLTGRETIYTDKGINEIEDVGVLCDVLNNAWIKHQSNKTDIDWLINYKKGQQPILAKEKSVRSEINNKLVINHAQMITRNIVGYFMGSPIQYIQDGHSDKKEQIDKLNRYVQYEDKATVDKEIAEIQSIVGTAYRIIYRDGPLGDEVPFEDRTLNPSTTYVVYSNDVSEIPLVGTTYYTSVDGDDDIVITKYAYTNFGVYEFKTDESGVVKPENLVSHRPYNVGGVPIIEYPNNIWKIGDWELAIGLMDAINKLHSGRFDDIDQIVQSLLVFINAEIDGETYDDMREKGAVMLKNTTGAKSSVESISNSLDQTGMNMFSEELENLLYAIIGIPSRNNRSGGGGDTGQAVELRDGWADLEIIARNKELTFKRSEKLTLKIILNMFNSFENADLSLLDLDIKFSRNKTNNIMVKTQSYQTLLATKTLSPSDCLSIVDLVSDVNEFISRGQAFWGDEFATSNRDYNTIESKENEPLEGELSE